MNERAKSRLAWSLWAILGSLLASEFLLFPLHPDAALLLAIAPPFMTVGAFVASRRPANPVGWLFLASGAAIVLRSFGTQYAYHGFVTDPGSLPGAGWVASIAFHAWHPSFTFLIFILLLFPDGHLPSRRWRLVAWLSIVTALSGFASGMLESSSLTDAVNLPFVEPPVTRTDAIAAPVFGVFLAVNGALLLSAMVALVLRLRRARGDERLQLRSFGYSVVVVVLALPISLLVIGDGRAFAAVTPLVPLAAAFAILKYRLYEIDVIIHRSLVYGALTLFVLVIYGGLVGIAQAVSRERLGLVFAVAAAAIVAVALAPLRDRVQRGVDRLLYGERQDPYGVLSGLSRRLEAAIAPDEVLTVVVDTVAQALKLPYVAVELRDETGVHVEATYGLPGRTVERMPLHYRGEIIGDLVLGLRAGEEQFAPSDRRLLEDLGRQVGVAAQAVALTRALQRSRERLVGAREEERRRLRRDLHDGLGPVLAGIALTLDAARRQLAHDPAAAEATLAEVRDEAQRAIADIRRLVYDLRPPALDDLGLLGALREHAARLSGAIQFSLDLPDRLPPLPAAVEVAAYRIVLEALTNVTRHAGAHACTLRLSVNGALELEVRDDGQGLPESFRPGVGLASMRERAAELGGDCTIERTNGHGTRVTAVLPLERP